MPHRHFASFRVPVLVAVAFICIASAGLAAGGAPGSYEISFYKFEGGVLEPVSSLPVCPAPNAKS